MIANSTDREFEDLRRKLLQGTPKNELDKVLDEIIRRAILFFEYPIRRVDEFYREVQALKELIDGDKKTEAMEVLLELKARVIRLRGMALKADKEEQVVQFSFA